MKIVLIAPSGAVASAIKQLGHEADHDEIVVATRSTPDTEVSSVVLTPSLRWWTTRASSALGGSALGRNVQRLTPLDAGRRFAAAARRNAELRMHITRADLIVVLERDGILTGWRAARNWAPRHASAVYGIPPAQAIIAAAR